MNSVKISTQDWACCLRRTSFAVFRTVYFFAKLLWIPDEGTGQCNEETPVCLFESALRALAFLIKVLLFRCTNR